MTEDRKNRKSMRSFNLEKKEQRSFDLEKEYSEAKPHPSLETKSQPEQNCGNSSEGGNELAGGSKKWFWVLVAIVVVIVAIIGIKQCGGSSSETIVPDTSFLDEATTDSTADETAETAIMNEDTLSTMGNTAPESEAPASGTLASETPAATPSSATAIPVSTTTAADVQQAANRVLAGEFGNGVERKQKLGADYRTIQDKVNEMYRKGLVH